MRHILKMCNPEGW